MIELPLVPDSQMPQTWPIRRAASSQMGSKLVFITGNCHWEVILPFSETRRDID